MPEGKKIPVVDYMQQVCDNAVVFRIEQPQMEEHDLFFLSRVTFSTSKVGEIPVDLGVFRHGVYLCNVTLNVTGPAWNRCVAGFWLPSEYRCFADFRTLDVGEIAYLNVFGYTVNWEDYP